MSLISDKQVAARRVDRAGELDLLLGAGCRRRCRPAASRRISSEFSGVRSSWRHVRQELGLVLGGQGELLGLLLERRARRSISRFFTSMSRFCRLSSAAFSCELLVGLLELARLRLQLLGQRLRLLEQLLGAHVGDDRVEHDADRLGELLEERAVDLAERPQRGQLDDARPAPRTATGSTTMLRRRRLAEPGRDLHVVLGTFGDEDRLLPSTAAWPTRPSPSAKRWGTLAALLVAVAGDQPQLGVLASSDSARKNAPCWAVTSGVSLAT